MSTLTKRVMVAAEQSSVRHTLQTKIKANPDYVIVGEAESGASALSLARLLQPDVVIIDSALPDAFGADQLPLSRIGGLDTAQAISEEVPNTRVILLTNEDTWSLPEVKDAPETVPAANAATVEEGRKRDLAGSSIFIGTIMSLTGAIMVITLLMASVGVFFIAAGLLTIAFGFVTGKFRSRGRSVVTATPQPGLCEE